MSILSDFQNIEKEPVASTILNLLLMISVGMIAIFYFDKNLFLTLDTIKLILLAISINIPFIIIAFIPLVPNLDNTFQTFSAGTFFSSISFFISLTITFLVKQKFDFPSSMTVLLTIIFELIMIMFVKKELKRK